MMKGGVCNATIYQQAEERLSGLEDNERGIFLLKPSNLKSKFTRNTNCTKVHDQSITSKGRQTGSCYAFAACTAYLTAIACIYGPLKKVPSYAECFKIADYNKGKGGYCCKSLRLLEQKFKFGIKFEIMEYMQLPSIKDVMVFPVIVCFNTSEQGYQKIANGALLEKPQGKIVEGHAAVIQSYDFENDYWECINSWGLNRKNERFNFRFGALNSFFCIKVFFTGLSVFGKSKLFIPKIRKFRHRFISQYIECAIMDERTANYSTQYVCEPRGSFYLGIKIDDYIKLSLKEQQNRKDYF